MTTRVSTIHTPCDKTLAFLFIRVESVFIKSPKNPFFFGNDDNNQNNSWDFDYKHQQKTVKNSFAESSPTKNGRFYHLSKISKD